MKYIITIGKKRRKREQYEKKTFETFQELVQFLRNGRQDTLANDYHKSICLWISSEACNKNTAFNQKNFKQNGSVAILDFDGELKLKDCKTILKDNNFSYYIYNSTNNGNEGKEKFRLILPLDKSLQSKEEVKTFYRAINKLFDGKADSSKLTSCILMNKPQHWKSTTRGENPNSTVQEIDEFYFDGINVNTDNIIQTFPEEKIEYPEWDSNALDKIDFDRQRQFAESAKNEFLHIPAGLGKRHIGLWNLSLKLKSYGLSGTEIQTILESVNHKETNQNINNILKNIQEKDIAINPSVFKVEFYKKEIIDKKLKKFKTSDNPIIITQDKKVSELPKFKTSDVFIEGINLFGSPTNSGKTYYVLNEYINYIDKGDFVVLLVPYLTLLQEIKTNPNVYAISGDDEFDIEVALKKRVIVSTYDKIKTLEYAQKSEFSFDKCHIFIDEAHNLYSSHSYRHKTLNKMFNLLVTHSVYKKLILMSGTFNTSYFGANFIDNYVNVRRDIGKDADKVSNELKECNVIQTSNSIIDSAVNYAMKLYDEDTSRLQIIYLNDKDKSTEIAKALLEQKKIKTLSLNANTKNDDIIKEIYKTNKIPNDINILFMTKIGEEGISFHNEIYAIHAIGKIDSTVAEQLGNRPRKHPTKLFIHTKHKDKSEEYVLNPSYNEIEEKHLSRIETINKDIRINKLQYEDRKKEEFFKFTLWDWQSNYVTLAPLAISKFLYESDRINEFNYYDYYFKEKMNHYGWNVKFIIDEGENEIRLNFRKNNPDEKRKEILIELFDLYKTYEENANDITGFIDYSKSNMSTNEIPDKIIKDTYMDYSYLSNYVDDAIIIEAIKSTNRNNKGLKKLFLQIHRELHGGHRIDKFVYTNIEINKEYTSDELQEFGQKYQDELYIYSPELIHKNPPSTQAINKLLDKYFEIQKLSKRIHGKKAQVTRVLRKKSVLKSSLKLNKEAKLIPPDDTSELLEVQEELYNTTAFIDFLAMDDEPESHISVEEYESLLGREKELKRLVKQIEKSFELKESNRSYSYIDEWL